MHIPNWSVVLVAAAQTFVLYQLFAIKADMRHLQRKFFVLLTDLEAKVLVADKSLEQRVLDKSRRIHDERIYILGKAISDEVAGEVETNVMDNIRGIYENIKSRRKASSTTIKLEMMAEMREFVHNYDTSIIPSVEYLNSLEQEDSILINYIQKQILVTPAPKHLPYNMKGPKRKETSQGQLDRILDIFKGKKDGTFIECGALDGEFYSNTLTLERDYGWTGILIEADPINFKNMLHRKRKSWMVPACLSLKTTPQMVAFAKNSFSLGKIDSEIEADGEKSDLQHYDIHCLPLTSILLALNQTQIDFFSLDIEGHELDVLRTIDFSVIDIKVLLVEFSHGAEPKEIMKNYMSLNGYEVYESTDPWTIENYIFIKLGSGLESGTAENDKSYPY